MRNAIATSLFLISLLAATAAKAEICGRVTVHWVAVVPGHESGGHAKLYMGLNWPKSTEQIRAAAATCSGATPGQVQIVTNHGTGKGQFGVHCGQNYTVCD